MGNKEKKNTSFYNFSSHTFLRNNIYLFIYLFIFHIRQDLINYQTRIFAQRAYKKHTYTPEER